ncbi:hypothetical protein [Rhizobium sp. BK176]|uniref:hypothetical protein n=1 Tax=Rhizobium sp. BK176 TaxID=2587071 RepID=UPI002167FC1E|nr:hypothetical protein [Rhizobium sp. BK176]MCS4088533.1 hypothetical protein [Rhizobium sp. BK176]
MHDHWKSVISSRTSSKEVVDATVGNIGKIRELEDEHDFQGQIEDCVASLTGWFSRAVRSRASIWGNPFRHCNNILDLIATVSKEKRLRPMSFVPSFVEEDEEAIYEIAGVGKIFRLATPEAIAREIAYRKVSFASEIRSAVKFSSKGPSEYWTARSADGELIAVGQTVAGIVWGAMFTAPGNRPAAEDLVTAYVVDNQLPMITATAVSGLVLAADGAFHRLTEIPAGTTINGDVDLLGKYADLTNWPDGVTVAGYLNIHGGRTGVRVSPPRLHVKGDLVWVDEALEAIGDGLVVDGNVSFHCGRLTKVGLGCSFGGDLWVANEAIIEETFTVAGKVFTGDVKSRRQRDYPRRSLIKRLLRVK